MKICIVGAGALGSAIGGVLARNGKDVVLVARSREHVEQIEKHGLVFVEGGRETAIPVRATTDAASLEPMDLVIVLVKSFATEEAVRQALPVVGPGTAVLSLQNGLGNEETIQRLVGPGRVIGGKAYAGGVLLAPGRVMPGVEGKEIVIGELDGGRTARIRAVADELNDGGVRTLVSDDIEGTIWDKLLVNVATGALAGITSLTYGELYEVPAVERTALGAVREGIDVARASGVRLSLDEPRAIWLKAAEGMPRGFKTSILQSLERGQRTEIDVINGAVVDRGGAVGVATPINATLVACIKGMERRWVRA